MNPSKDIFKRAEQAAKKQNFEYAIELYLQGLQIHPKASDERRVLHRVMRQVVENAGGNPAGGLKTKLSVAGCKAKVKKLKMQKKWDEAILEQERVVRPQPSNSHELYELADMLAAAEYDDSAIGVLQDVIDVDKGHVEAHRKLGQLYTKLEDPKKAIECWEKVRLYKPDDKEAGKAVRDLSASTLVDAVEKRRAESGDESYRAMLKDEEESEDLEKKNKVIRTDQDRVEAIGFKKEDLRADPKNSRLWRELGALYRDLRQWKHAVAAYKKALEVNPHDLFASDKIGEIQEAILDDTVATMKTQLAGLGEDGAERAELQGKLDAAEAKSRDFKVTEYERRVRAHPTDFELKVQLGELLRKSERLDEAIEQFQKAVKDPKLRVRAQNLMGQCFFEKGVFSIAISQYQTALASLVEKDSDIAKDVSYNLAVAHEANGDIDAALEIHQKIMGADISYRDVSQRVSELIKKK